MAKDKKLSVDHISIGYDQFLKSLEDKALLKADSLYPPHNIRKTSSGYAIDIQLDGYEKGDIKASLTGGLLSVTASEKTALVKPAGDYVVQGIFPGGPVDVAFMVAPNLSLDKANYASGVLTIDFSVKNIHEDHGEITIGPADAAEPVLFAPIYNSSGEVVAKRDRKEEKEDYKIEKIIEKGEREEKKAVVNAESNRKPTVEVVLPDPMPQVVEVAIEEVKENVDKKSSEPQAVVVVKDAQYEVVSDDVVTDLIKTEEGKADIVVAIPAEVAEVAHDAGIKVVDVIEQAMEAVEAEAPALPEVVEEKVKEVKVKPKDAEEVTMTVPEEISSVVEVKVVDEEIVMSDASEHVPASAELIPVVTAEGQSDVVVAVTPSNAAKLEDLGVDVATDIGAALVEEEVPVVESVVEAVEVPVEDVVPTTTTVVNAENPEVPTVAVELPVELPQIVEVKVEKVKDKVDNKSEEPQIEVIVSDATYEVSDNTTLEVVKTEATKSDVVVSIPDEVAAELEAAGVDALEVVADAIGNAASSETVLLPETPVVEAAPTQEVIVEAPDTPEEVKIVLPDIVPQVMEVTVEENVPLDFNSSGVPTETGTLVTVSDASENIPEGEVVPVVTATNESDAVLVVPEEVKAVLEEKGVDVVKEVEAALQETESAVVPVESFSEGVVAEEVVEAEPAAEVVAPEVVASTEEVVDETAAVVTTIVNADNPELPTVEITAPDPLPQIVEVTVDEVAPVVDTTSEEPQVKVTLSDATYEVVDDATVDVVKTEEGVSDVVVSVPPEAERELGEAGVDIVSDVATAIETTEIARPELPTLEPIVEDIAVVVNADNPEVPTVEVVAPEVIPQIVEATAEIVENVDTANSEPQVTITLSDVSEDVPVDADVIPVVTADGQSDIMVAVSGETKNALEEAGVNIAEDLGAALQEANTTVSVNQ